MSRNARVAQAHCSTCSCQDDAPPRPATSSAWARRQALEAAAEAVRLAKIKGGRA